jgi:SRSO17 transposase
VGEEQQAPVAEVAGWEEELEAVAARLGPRFGRREARGHARAYLRGLTSPVRRKNGWQLAEALGEPAPYGVQQFLYRADWEADAVRDDLRGYVLEHLADDEAVLILDETGFPKKGDKSAGVAAQYCGTLGKIANCQVGVFLLYAGRRGAAFLDRALYLPHAWADAAERRAAASIPEDVAFATKPGLGRRMLGRALDAGVPARWATADEGYGDDHRLRMMLEARPLRYVLAVSGKDSVVTEQWAPHRVSELVAALAEPAWRRLSCGDGAKGPRSYDWQRLRLIDPLAEGWARWLLIRRSVADPTERQAYVCFAPEATTLEELIAVAGRRWAIEAGFEHAKQEVGLDDYEVRSWQGWHRHVTLALVAHALLTVLRAHGHAAEAEKRGGLQQPTTMTTFRTRRAARQPSSRSPSPRLGACCGA